MNRTLWNTIHKLDWESHDINDKSHPPLFSAARLAATDLTVHINLWRQTPQEQDLFPSFLQRRLLDATTLCTRSPHLNETAIKGYDAQDLIIRMDKARDRQQASEDHASNDWTIHLESWPCTDTSTKALQKLPRVRELTLRPRRLGGLKIKGLNVKPKKSYQEAALGQICGDLALTACLRCTNDKGPFVECVIVQGHFDKSCCNCHYSSQGLACSFRDLGE